MRPQFKLKACTDFYDFLHGFVRDLWRNQKYHILYDSMIVGPLERIWGVDLDNSFVPGSDSFGRHGSTERAVGGGRLALTERDAFRCCLFQVNYRCTNTPLQLQ